MVLKLGISIKRGIQVRSVGEEGAGQEVGLQREKELTSFSELCNKKHINLYSTRNIIRMIKLSRM